MLRGTTGRERGAALLVAVFVLAISLLLVLAFLDAAALEGQLASSSCHYVQARHVAAAGVEDAIAEYRDDPSQTNLPLTTVEFPPGSGHHYEREMRPAQGGNPGREITSTGTVAGISRVITAEVELVGSRVLVRRWEED
ncbi:MAG: hypothetical protein ACE5R4_02410 [Armatimonadota bacterium]